MCRRCHLEQTRARFEPRDALLVRLGADERPAFLLGDREELLCQLGVALLLLGPGVAFEDASIPLAQAVDGDDLAFESRTVTDDLCGLEGARERAGVQAFERLAGEAVSCEARLRPSSLREWELHLALPDAFRIRSGLSVTHQEQLL